MNRKLVMEDAGVGATEGCSLRVSIATLVRVIFECPSDGSTMLALERKATFQESAQFVEIKSLPFGGAMRILDLDALQKRIGDFRFDSEESRAERDFRIFIRPVSWKALQEFCIKHLKHPNDPVLESDPTRELTEEFGDTLGIRLYRDQFSYHVVGIFVEDHPSPTENVQARGHPTARIYKVFEARILDPSLVSALIRNSESCSDQNLRERALQNLRNSGQGRANATLTVPLRDIHDLYETVLSCARNRPVFFRDHKLDETVAAVLEGVTVPKYRSV